MRTLVACSIHTGRRSAVAGVLIVAGLAATIPTRAHDGFRHDDDRDRQRAPKVILISLDGAKPQLVERYLRSGVLDWDTGLGRVRAHGVAASENLTVTPSVTAVAHVAIATGSTAAHNDISANTFHPVAASIGTSLSGFAAPIGGYRIQPLGPALIPTAEPLWVQLRNSGRQVVTATWPGGDGADIRINNGTVNAIVQAASPTRTVDYTVPFGAFGGLGAVGFTLTAAQFTPASGTLIDQINAAGRRSYSPIQATAAPIETFFCAPDTTSTCGTQSASRTRRYDIAVAALDLTNDRRTNYDTLVFFDVSLGILPGPFALPSTGPAYARAGRRSSRFFFEGSGDKIGTAFFVNRIAPDLSTVRFARYGANFIPRNTPVLDAVDDINEHVGFWAPQPDFRIPERVGTTSFDAFSDEELEAIYEDQVKTFVEYQTKLAQRAILANRDAELVMIYIEQPDGSGHQFTLTDPRQASNPRDPASIGVPAPGATGQDPAKVARYARYLEFAYRSASNAVDTIIRTAGVDRRGEPLSDVFVVSDHGMAPFHTAVSLGTILSNAGIILNQIGIRTTGPATNVYLNLMGREPNGNVSSADYPALVNKIANVLRNAVDQNPWYNPQARPLFTHVWTRPASCGMTLPGLCTDDNIGQDTGDVLALMDEGYNFDGTQSPVVTRLGDTAAATNPFSVPNFYGAHGHDSELSSMSAIFYAAGPHVAQGRTLRRVRNVDVAPTILDILGFSPVPTVDGRSLVEILRRDRH